MAVTLGSLTIDRLQAQPCGWSETDVQAGLAARRWSVVGRVRSAQWLAIWDAFDAWRATRMTDAPTMASLATGTTVTFSGSSYGKSWTNVPCWFTAAPQGEAVGVFIRVSFELVAAADQLAVMLRQQELSRLEDAALLPAYGTYSLGGVTLTLLEEPDGFEDVPSMALAATGTSYVQGARAASQVKRIQGWCAPSNKSTLLTWFANAIQARPTAGSWFPASDPQFSQDRILVNGAVVERLIVTITMKLAR
jgi:hypothetical protein